MMSMFKRILIWTASLFGILALILSERFVKETVSNLISNLFAVIIGSCLGVLLFVIFLNILERKKCYSAHELRFEEFFSRFVSAMNGESSNIATLRLVVRTTDWFSWFRSKVQLIFGKLVYRLGNSTSITEQIGRATPTSTDRNMNCPSLYELMRPNGQTPDEMLSSAYGPNAYKRSSSTICVSPKVDEVMHKIFEYTYRDYVETWYGEVSSDRGIFHKVLQADYWDVVKAFSARLSRLDTVNLIMNRFVTCILHHMEELKLTAKASKDDDKPSFSLHPCLRDRNTELTYLRHICDYILILTLPPEAARISSLRYILREVLAGLAFLPMVETLCDPDYINQTILMYFQNREATVEDQSRAYAYAATYEDFIKIINDCKSVSVLRQIRYRIMTEIIHATTISSLKKDQSKAGKAKSMDKGELLLNRDLKRYINQCEVAKQQCEKKIRLLGGDEYGAKYSPPDGNIGVVESQLLSFDEIMNSAITRSYFLKYLRKIGKASLLKYWNEVEVIRATNPTGKNLAKIVSHVYQNYILSDSADQLPFDVDRPLVQGMQDCVLGNKAPVDFFTVHKQVYEVMEKDHYPSFVVSDIYSYQLMPEITDRSIYTDVHTVDESLSQTAFGGDRSADASMRRLRAIEEKLEYKAQALEGLRSMPKIDEKVTQRLMREINVLQTAKCRQQLHMERSDAWWDNMGKWNATIEEAHTSTDEGSITPIYTIIVQCSGVPFYKTNDDVSGWIVVRSLAQFHQLHHSLKEFSDWMKKHSLPKLPMFRLKGFSDKFLSGSKQVLNSFMAKLLEDDTLRCSQIVYSFLSPGPDATDLMTLLAPDDARRLSGVRLAENIGGFLKKFPKDVMDRVMKQAADDEISDLLTDDEESNARDSVAEPLYKLISEVFELHGLFRFLRRSLIVFVRVAFGRSINRQVRDTSDWLVSEPMVRFYLQIFLDSMWPDGQLAPPNQSRTDDEKLQTKLELQVKLLQNLPEALNGLVGQVNAKHGVLKMFHALQDKRLNKHLFYNLLTETMEELFLEILRNED